MSVNLNMEDFYLFCKFSLVITYNCLNLSEMSKC